MENVVKNFDLVKEEISNFKNANIVAVSKTFPISHILPLINHGHQHFGENKVQEAQEKWTSIKNDFPNLKLHLIGKLQTNKVKFCLPLFDFIHSLDNIKLAEKASLLRNYGQSNRYEHSVLGLNSRLDTLQAIVLLNKLDIFDEELAKVDKVFAGVDPTIYDVDHLGSLKYKNPNMARNLSKQLIKYNRSEGARDLTKYQQTSLRVVPDDLETTIKLQGNQAASHDVAFNWFHAYGGRITIMEYDIT